MEDYQDEWITTAILEHACKENFENVTKSILMDPDTTLKMVHNFVHPSSEASEKPSINPLFLFVSFLKKMHSLDNFTLKSVSPKNVLPVMLDLLETTYKQFNFMSLKRFFTLTSELKLLDLLNLIVDQSESSLVVQKLNQHFPRWSSDYRLTLEKDFNIENSKVLDKVEESHTQCRRLILKLAVDNAHKAKYISEQYSTDLNRLTRESKAYIMEAITTLEAHAGSSVLEKMLSGGEETKSYVSENLGAQLLLDYIQPEITSDGLLKYLDDSEPIRNSQPASALTSCLLPFDTMSEVSDESEESESECESSEDISDAIKSSEDVVITAP